MAEAKVDEKTTNQAKGAQKEKPADKVKKKASDRKVGLKNLSLSDRVLGVIALWVVAGWSAVWLFREDETFNLFREFFQTLSFCGALVVVLVVGLKLCALRVFPEKAEGRALAVASLLPVLGYLIEIITSLGSFLTIGGSIALAYISATTYWRNRIPQFATDPLGASNRRRSQDNQKKGGDASSGGEEEEEKKVKELSM